MVTQAIATTVRVASTISGILSALDAIKKARKDCESLAKAGFRVQAQKLEKELDRQEQKLRRSLSRELARRARQRSQARRQTRASTGRFV